MNLRALFHLCVQQIQRDGAEAIVVFKMNRKARGARIRLTPRSGPYGEIVQGGEDMTVGVFKAVAVVKWIEGLAEVAAMEERGGNE